MECAVKTDPSKNWLRNDLESVGSIPSSSTLCSAVCRRAASFPVVNGHHSPASLLRVRSQSESDALNRFGLITSRAKLIEQLKKYQFASLTSEKSANNDASSWSGESKINLSDSDGDDDNGNKLDHSSGFVENVVPTNVGISPQKCVRFADDCGKELTTIRVMTEPSDYPPAISESVIRGLLGNDLGQSEQSKQTSASWVISFKQPASEYVRFRETLERGFVVLENVVLKNDISHMVGTIKVKNITFHKKVFIRYTADGWKSFLDCMATYQPSSSKFYDTFSFDIELPSNGNDPNARIEFCICFEAGPSQDHSNLQQYWDSNGGSNYVLKSSDSSIMETLQHAELFGKQDQNDAYTYDFKNWTRFAAWRNLSTKGPYW